jgi:hypothetical protein
MRGVREGFVTTAVIGAWLLASAVFYFLISDTIVGLVAGLAVLVAVPVSAIWFSD